MMKRDNLAIYIVVALVYIYLFVPVLVTFIWSISKQWFSYKSAWFPQEVWIAWYQKIFTSSALRIGFVYTFLLAPIVTIFSMLIATPAAYVISTRTQKAKIITETIMMIPVMTPMAFLASTLFRIYLGLGLTGTFVGVALVQTIGAAPYMLRCVTSAFESIDKNLIIAARDLGASEFKIFTRIMLPLGKKGIFAGAVFSFSRSVNEVLLTYSIGRPKIRTLTVIIFEYISEYGMRPAMASAISIVLIMSSVVLWFIMDRYISFEDIA